jgi:hypothetical protein
MEKNYAFCSKNLSPSCIPQGEKRNCITYSNGVTVCVECHSLIVSGLKNRAIEGNEISENSEVSQTSSKENFLLSNGQKCINKRLERIIRQDSQMGGDANFSKIIESKGENSLFNSVPSSATEELEDLKKELEESQVRIDYLNALLKDAKDQKEQYLQAEKIKYCGIRDSLEKEIQCKSEFLMKAINDITENHIELEESNAPLKKNDDSGLDQSGQDAMVSNYIRVQRDEIFERLMRLTADIEYYKEKVFLYTHSVKEHLKEYRKCFESS